MYKIKYSVLIELEKAKILLTQYWRKINLKDGRHQLKGKYDLHVDQGFLSSIQMMQSNYLFDIEPFNV